MPEPKANSSLNKIHAGSVMPWWSLSRAPEPMGVEEVPGEAFQGLSVTKLSG